MPLLKSRLFAAGLLTAGVGAAVAFGAVGGTQPAPLQAANEREAAREPDGGVRVEAPHAKVDVDEQRGRVSVKAPHTDVHVDPDKGRVQVRAPYVNLDIRW